MREMCKGSRASADSTYLRKEVGTTSISLPRIALASRIHINSATLSPVHSKGVYAPNLIWL